MKRLKLTASYQEGDKIVTKTMTVLVAPNKEQDVFDFEAFVNSKADELKLAVISSNVDILTWNDEDGFPDAEMSSMAATVDPDLLVATCPRLPDNPENIMVFCPESMELFVKDGGFAEVYRDIRDTYESMYWSGSGDHWDLIVYFKDGKTMRHAWPQL